MRIGIWLSGLLVSCVLATPGQARQSEAYAYDLHGRVNSVARTTGSTTTIYDLDGADNRTTRATSSGSMLAGSTMEADGVSQTAAPPEVMTAVAPPAVETARVPLSSVSTEPTASLLEGGIIVPPVFYNTDARGVDLVSGRFYHTERFASVGDPAQGGLAWDMTYIQQPDDFRSGWRDGFVGTVNRDGDQITVSLGASSETFTESSLGYNSDQRIGSTLSTDGYFWTYTLRDGTVARFNRDLASIYGNWDGNEGFIQFLTRPNGEVQQYSYTSTYFCRQAGTGPCPEPTVRAVRLQSVQNNRGYQISLEYVRNDAVNYSQWGQWIRLKKVTAFNRTVDACEPSATSCSFSRTWPSATFDTTNVTFQTATNALNQTTSYSYYAGFLGSVTRPGDAAPSIALTYWNPDGRVHTHSNGIETYTYNFSDSSGTRTITVVDPAGQPSLAVSDMPTGTLTSLTDPLGRTRQFTYDNYGRMLTATQPEGNSVGYTYDLRGNILETRARAKPASGIPDIVASATYPDLFCTNTVICNQPVTTTDERGNVTDYAYDGTHGGLTVLTKPAPSSGAARPQIRISYTSLYAWYRGAGGIFGQATTPITLPTAVSQCMTGTSCDGTASEARTTITYGVSGVSNNLQPTQSSQGAGDGSLTATTTLAYTPSGDVRMVDGPLPGSGESDDDVTLYWYDAMRRLYLVREPVTYINGNSNYRAQRYTRNAKGDVTLSETGTTTDEGESFSAIQGTTTTYDLAGRVTSGGLVAGGVTYALTQASYDVVGRPACQTVRMNPATFGTSPTSACTLATAGTFGPDRITAFTYDAANQLTVQTSGYGTTSAISTSTTYTANGQPQTQTDGASNVSTLIYDGFDRLHQLRHPNATGGGSSTTDYEEYGYDPASNVVSHRNRAGETITSAYDALNRRTSLGGAAVADRTFGYDNLDRMTAAAYTSPSVSSSWAWDALGRLVGETQSPPNKTLTYQYDLAGRRTRITWPDNLYVQYDWDFLNNLTAIRENGATSGVGVLAAYGYDSLGRRTFAGRGNGVGSSWGYDGASRLISLSHDISGTANDLTLGYAYNPAGQIVTRTLSNPAYAYTPGAGTVSYANSGKNQVTAVGGSGVGYDGRQNITTAPTGTYGYDALNQLTTANSAGLVYDPTGRLNQVSTGSVATRFLYEGQQVVGEYDASGSMLRRYVPGFGVDEVATAYEGAGTADRRWLLADERQSVVSITNGSAVGIATNTYDEYGVPGAANAGRFQYTGQVWIPEAQLYHYRARAYAPGLGRFMQPDPAGYAAGPNLYAYVGADPLNLTDPSGLGAGDCEYGILCPVDLDEIIVTGSRLGRSSPGSLGGESAGSGAGNGAVTLTTVQVFGQRIQRVPPTPEQEREWEELYERDIAICRGLPNASVRARCYDSANQRNGDRRAGRPLGPLVTQREAEADKGLVVAGVTLTGTALILYLIVSEGSRLFPPRNLIPIP